MHLSLEAFGDVQFSREMLRFGERGENLSPIFEIIARDFYEIEKRQFATEGRFASGGWPPLTPGYAAWKEQHFPGKKILERTGAMKAALTQPNAEGAVKRTTPDVLEITTSLAYPQYHQNARDSRRRRKPVELRETDRVRWTKLFQRYLVTGDVGMGIGL